MKPAAQDRSPALAPGGAAERSALSLEDQQEKNDREDLAAARAARAAADPRRALALYEHLASRSGPAAENASIHLNRCLFAPGGIGLRVPSHSSVVVNDSGFAPQLSAIQIREDANADDSQCERGDVWLQSAFHDR